MPINTKTDTDVAHRLADRNATSITSSSQRGPKATVTHFRGRKEVHRSAREAYISLIEHFITESRDPLEKALVTKGRSRNYFARSKESLFPRSPHLIDNRSNWQQLKCGWYAITNLSATENFKRLCSYGNACRLSYGKDWDFEPCGATEETSDAKRREQINQVMITNALADLDAMV